MKKYLPFLLYGILMAPPNFLPAQFSVSKLFGDHMVLQRDQEIRIWGWAQAGDKVEVNAFDQKKEVELEKEGRWILRFPQMPAGGPYTIDVSLNGQVVKTIEDVMLGDVWVCSGQSNMEWLLKNTENAEAEIAAVNDSQIRHFKVPLTYAEEPASSLAGGEWKQASSETVDEFTAVGYYFAKEIRKHQKVSIGLLNSSWGGSKVEAWMRAELMGAKNAETIIQQMKEQAQKEYEALVKKIKLNYPGVTDKDAGLQNGQALWAAPDLKDSDWAKLKVPLLWESDGYEGFDGIAWYRYHFELNEAEAANDIELGLGKIDDSDITWVNGVEVGQMTQAWDQKRTYRIPADVLKVGDNTIAVRVDDTGGGGGIYGDPTDLYLNIGDQKRPIDGDWLFRPSAILAPGVQSRINHTPTYLYNKMIHPILSFPIRGVLWYQGESNTEQAVAYRDQFSGMIQDWRKLWGIGDFPFLYVQLANFMAPNEVPEESNWAKLREAQSQTLSVPNTAQAVIIDIGEADDIHPRNKKDVGKRLAVAARHLSYGESVVFSGPTYRSHQIIGNKIYVNFDHIGSGLLCKNRYGYLNAFAIAGEDKVFHWAKATIEGNRVKVWSEKVLQPKYVRYAWANNPDDANLYNMEGLPASPFRTDQE